jgi:hypothetical protein
MVTEDQPADVDKTGKMTTEEILSSIHEGHKY